MRSSKTFSIQFWMDTRKTSNGHGLVYARITVDGRRLSISLKRKLLIDQWDFEKKQQKGNSQKARVFNQYLDLSKGRLYECYQQLRDSGENITSMAIKDLFLSENSSHRTLRELIGYHSQRIANTHAIGSIRNFEVTEGYVSRFLVSMKLDDISLSKLNYEFLCNFERFLNSFYPKGHPRAMGHNTITKHIQRLRKIVTLGYNLEWLGEDPFRRWQSRFEKVDSVIPYRFCS